MIWYRSVLYFAKRGGIERRKHGTYPFSFVCVCDHIFPFINRLQVIHNMCGDNAFPSGKDLSPRAARQLEEAIHQNKETEFFIMAQKNNRIVVPEAKAAMEQFKKQAASEVGVNLQNGYNGELTARQAGSIGGQMVKKMIENYENSLSAK